MVLYATPGMHPRLHEPFVIVDDRLRLQAVSRQAEIVLMVDEPEAVDAALHEFLVPKSGDQDHIQLAGLVADAIAGSPQPVAVELNTVGDPEIGFVVHVAGCGPPPAALLTLTPPKSSRTRRGKRGPVELRGCAVLPAGRRAAAAPGDPLHGRGVPPRADRATR